MKFKNNTGLLFNPQSTEGSDEPAFELSLYDELMTFSNLLPEEQEAQVSRPPAPTPPPARPASAPLPPISLVSAPPPASEPPPERMSGPLRTTGSLPPKRPPTAELHPPRAITPSAHTYDQMKELAIELTNRAIESVSEGPKPIASEVIRRSTRELTSVPPPGPAPVADDELFDPQTASIFKITGPLPVTKASTSTAPALSICTNCGSHADTDEMFCITCGELLEALQTPAVEVSLDPRCEDCGEVVAGEDIFCPSCGSVISGA